MNPTMVELLGMLIAVAVGLTLLIIGSHMTIRNNRIDEEDENEDLKARIDFLKAYSIQLESMKNQATITEEQYQDEIAWLDEEIDELGWEAEIREKR